MLTKQSVAFCSFFHSIIWTDLTFQLLYVYGLVWNSYSWGNVVGHYKYVFIVRYQLRASAVGASGSSKQIPAHLDNGNAVGLTSILDWGQFFWFFYVLIGAACYVRVQQSSKWCWWHCCVVAGCHVSSTWCCPQYCRVVLLNC